MKFRSPIDVLEPRRLFSTYALADIAAFSSAPADALVTDGSGNLFGTSVAGGSDSDGSIYKVAAGTDVVTTLASFAGGVHGLTPIGPIAIDSAGDLFGTTAYGGAGGYGTIFELPSGSSSITTLTSFTDIDGATPGHAGVILDSSGDLFGATSGGGNASGDGVVYELPHGSSGVTVLASFAGGDSADPQGRLVRDTAGDLFGTSRSVGANGTVYEVVAGSNAVTTLATFDGSDGQYPQGVLAADSSGDLFGTTESGGANNGGTVFEVPAGASLVTLASLDTSSDPTDSGLVLDSSGDVFGDTASNASGGNGTIFELRQGAGETVTLATFDSTTGSTPTALISDGGSGLYGVTSGGTGALFHLTENSSGAQTTTTALQVSSATVVTGQPVTFTAIVAPPAANDETPAGIVDFSADGNFLGSATLDGNGDATLTTSALPIGQSDVIASYAGDSDSLNSDSPAVTVAVTASTSTPFSDMFAITAGRSAGESLGGAAVQSSSADTWVTSGAGNFDFSTTSANTLNATDTGADVARVYRSLGSGTYTVAANLWPGTDSADPWLGVGFLSSGGDPAAGDPLYFRIQSSGGYELDATGSGGASTVLASGTANADTWSATNPPRVDLTWNTAGGTVSAAINGIAVARNLGLSSVAGLNSGDVNSVGLAKQGVSDATLAVTNFSFTSDAGVSTAATIGGLDPAFGSAGITSAALGFTSLASSTPDGSGELVLGNTTTGFALALLNADGSLDTSFGTDGVATGTFGTAAAVAVLGDGTVMVAGTTAGSAFAVEHFSAAGAAAGVTALPNFAIGSTDAVHAMTVSGSTIYLAGETTASGNGNVAVAAISESGSAITGFGSNGLATLDLGGNDTAYALAVQRNGRLVLAGASVNGSGAGSVAVARLLASGVPDKSFDRTGYAITSVRGLDDAADAVAIQKNGAIVVGGWSATSATSSDFLMIRYTAAGKVDRSFGHGPVITSFGQPSAVTQVAIDSSGNVIASGKTLSSLTGYSGDTNLAVARYNTRGAADSSFNISGQNIVDINAASVGGASASALQQFDTSGQGVLSLSGNDIDLIGDANGSTVTAAVVADAQDLSITVAKAVSSTTDGKRIAVPIHFTETGNVAAGGELTLALSLSSDGQTIDSIALATVKLAISLKPGKSRVYRAVVTIPSGLRGSYFVLAAVSGVTDLDAADNLAVGATAISITPAVKK